MEQRHKDEQLAKERIRIEKLNEIENKKQQWIKTLINEDYVLYFKKFNVTRENAKQLQTEIMQKGLLTRDQIEEVGRNFIKEITKKWPQSYRSLCTFEPEELVCFQMFPIEAQLLTGMQQPIR